MASAKKCDRCGKFYDPYNQGLYDSPLACNTIDLKRIDKSCGYYNVSIRELDFCPDCLKEILYFIFGDDVDIRPYLGEVEE